MKNSQLSTVGLVAAASLFLVGLDSSPAAVVNLTASDTGAQSSFNTGLHWSDSLAPSAENTYTVTGVELRTPSASGSFTFTGSSLTLTKSLVNGVAASLAYKGTGGGTDVITVGNLILGAKGTIVNFTNNSFTLDGTITTTATGADAPIFRLDGTNGGYVVASLITGTGALLISSNGQTSQVANKVSLTHANNSYSGGTTVGSFSNLAVQADGALGSGNLILNSGKITMELGVTNNYVADTARVILAAGLADGSFNLNFIGIDSIAGLSLNGGSSFVSAGSYDAAALNGLYGSDVFAGSGVFLVVPEPGAWALMSISLMIFASVRLRRVSVLRKNAVR